MNARTPLLKALAFSLLTLACTTRAFAAGAMMQDCRPDYQKFCSSAGFGGGHIAECLKEHKTELSPACAADLLSKAQARLSR
ncbi:MAG: cysteine rich repeat-containing protein [Pseudomonas sp.]